MQYHLSMKKFGKNILAKRSSIPKQSKLKPYCPDKNILRNLGRLIETHFSTLYTNCAFFSLLFLFLKKLYKTFFVWKITPENSVQMETGTMPCNSVNCHHGNQKNKPFWNWYRRHTLSNSSIFQPPSVLRNKMPSHWEVRERNHHERFVDVHCLVNNKKSCTQLTTL